MDKISTKREGVELELQSELRHCCNSGYALAYIGTNKLEHVSHVLLG